MGPTCVLSAPDGPHVGPMNLAIRVYALPCLNDLRTNINDMKIIAHSFQDDIKYLVYNRWSHYTQDQWVTVTIIQWYYFELNEPADQNNAYHIEAETKRPILSDDIFIKWRHNGRDGVSNHQPPDCLLNRLFRRRSKKASKLRVTGLCVGNSPMTGEFPAQRTSNAENVSIWWRHHVKCIFWYGNGFNLG